ATSYGVAVYDRSVDPPRLVASLPVPGTTRLLRLGNGVAYAGSGNTIAVIRKSGRSLQLVRTVDAGAPVNDILVMTLSLYVATPNGVTLYSLGDPTTPTFLTTFWPNAVSSLAVIGSTLYAADGDTSIEVLSAAPVIQRLGAITNASNATAVHVQNGKLYVSSAIDTSVFVGSG